MSSTRHRARFGWVAVAASLAATTPVWSELTAGGYGEPLPTVVDGTVDPRLHGSWRLLGYAQLLVIAADGWRFFDDDGALCIEDREVDAGDFGAEYAGHTAAGGAIRYGLADESIGYISIRSFSDLAEEDAPGAHEAEIDSAFEGLYALLAEDDPLIVDLSHNAGGEDYLARRLASWLVREPREAYTKWAATAPRASRQRFRVEPLAARRGPIYILTSDLTMSASEVALMPLHDLPYVTLAGESTRGAMSDRMTKPLPNGWKLQFGNELYVAPDGELYEGRGFEPDLPLAVFAADRIERGHAEAVIRLLEQIRASHR